MSHRESLEGRIFGDRTVIDDSDEGSHCTNRRILVRCVCGRRQRVEMRLLRRSTCCDDCSRARRSEQAASRSVLTDEQIRGLRCSAVRSRSACDDVAGWYTVDGWLAVCSSGCGPNGADDTRTE